MARSVDIIIFGATGFTGKHAIPIIDKLSKTNNRQLTWGIAGRSEVKLKSVLAEYEGTLSTPLNDIPIIVANVEDQKSLNEMARKARIIINCCGPFILYGESTVKACIEEGTHQVDVTGEPEYMEKIQLKYHKKAQEKGVYIISACGFDSIPTDLGVVYLQQKFAGTLNSVVTYLTVWEENSGAVAGSSVNIGTWESVIHAVSNYKQLQKMYRDLFPKALPRFKPELRTNKLPHKTDLVKGWIIPFPGADSSVVRRSQRYFYENDSQRPIQIATHQTVSSLWNVVLLSLFGAILLVFSQFGWGRSLLRKYPEIFTLGYFSRQPPSEEKIKNSRFSVTLYGEGWKNKLSSADDQYTTPLDTAVAAKVQGRNLAYGATNVCLVLSAITVVTETDKMPSNGGVYPPGYAFAKTSLIEELNKNEVTFETLFEKNLR